MEDLEAQVADHELVARLEECSALGRRKGVLPVGTTFAREQETRTRATREGPTTGDEVGVDMRFGDVRDAQSFVRRGVKILVDVTVRIDDECFAGGLAADEPARLREPLIVESLEQHGPRGGRHGPRRTPGALYITI